MYRYECCIFTKKKYAVLKLEDERWLETKVNEKSVNWQCALVKTNSFVHFLEESSAWQLAFEINWLLE